MTVGGNGAMTLADRLALRHFDNRPASPAAAVNIVSNFFPGSFVGVSLGNRIAAHVKQHPVDLGLGYTRQEAADRLGVPASTWIGNGELRNATLDASTKAH